MVSRGDIPAEASTKSWALCIQTRMSKMIQETLFLEETKQEHKSPGSSSSTEPSLSMNTGSLLETLKEARLLRTNQRKNSPRSERKRVSPIYRQTLITVINGALIGTVALVAARLPKSNERLTRGASLWEPSQTLVSNRQRRFCIKSALTSKSNEKSTRGQLPWKTTDDPVSQSTVKT